MCLTFSKSEAITLRELIWVVCYRLIKEGVRREALRRYANIILLLGQRFLSANATAMVLSLRALLPRPPSLSQ